MDRNSASTTKGLINGVNSNNILFIDLENGMKAVAVEEDDVVIISIDIKPFSCNNTNSKYLHIYTLPDSLSNSIGEKLKAKIRKSTILCISYDDDAEYIDLKLYIDKTNIEQAKLTRIAESLRNTAKDIVKIVIDTIGSS